MGVEIDRDGTAFADYTATGALELIARGEPLAGNVSMRDRTGSSGEGPGSETGTRDADG